MVYLVILVLMFPFDMSLCLASMTELVWKNYSTVRIFEAFDKIEQEMVRKMKNEIGRSDRNEGIVDNDTAPQGSQEFPDGAPAVSPQVTFCWVSMQFINLINFAPYYLDSCIQK